MIEIGKDQVPKEVLSILGELGVSSRSGDQEREIGDARRGQLGWVWLLRRFVGDRLAIRPDFGRPPRRFPKLVGVLPGRRRRTSQPKVMVVIDTSGSITHRILELINAELSRLASDFHVTVVECDAEIQRVYGYKRIESVVGGGGTDFRPPLAPEFLRRQRPNLVVYFTDGLGPVPTKAPKVPVLWCLAPGGRRPCNWGEAIEMSEESPK